MPLSGVLISWDILAIKLDLNSLASSAWRLAVSRSCCICVLWRISLRSLLIQKNDTPRMMAAMPPASSAKRIICE